jgi:alginate O-acetyltransferase complex protein AlgI
MTDGREWRAWGLLALNLVFVYWVVSGWQQALALAGFCLAFYLAMLVVADGRSHWLPVVLVVEVGLFVWLKQYTLVAGLALLPAIIGLTGISYLLFRGIHLTVDVASGALARPGFLTFINYLLFFPSFVSGPIQRFEEISEQLMDRGRSPGQEEAFTSVIRIIFGYLKVTLISAALLDLHSRTIAHTVNAVAKVTLQTTPVLTHLFDMTALASAGFFIVAAVAYTVFLYVNFSGYMDIVVSLARLMGFTIPENFRHPFSAGNFLEFWTRWHITLADWFRFYVFNPVLKTMARRWPKPAWTPYLGVIAFFLTFTTMGIWHGSTSIFVYYGLMLGFGVSGNRLYQVLMTKRLGRKKYDTLKRGRIYRALSRGAVFTYFALALSCLFFKEPHFSVLFARAGVWLVPATVGLIVVAAAVLILWDWVEAAFLWGGRRIVGASPLIHSSAVAAALIILIGLQVLYSAPAPEFVYQGF